MSSIRRRWRFAIATLAVAGALLLPRLPRYSVVHAQPPENELTVYSPQTTFTVPLLDIKGQPYVGLVELLEPLGSVEARPDGKKYKLHYTPPGGRPLEAQFTEGKDKGKLRGENYTLSAAFVLQNGRGYVPLAAAHDVLLRLTSQDVEYHPASRRLFLGGVAERYTLDLRKENTARLFISFPNAVNPSIATEPGHVRLTFRREPVVSPGAESVKFPDSTITGATYSEQNGIAELDIQGSAPLMANFADSGKTIVVSAVPAPPPAVAQAPEIPAPAPSAAPPAAPQPQKPAAPRFLVLIDPAHGGEDTGAAITPSLPEKDVVLALARRVQRELSSRGIAAGMLRNSDIAISLDQRAISTNAARPALYVSLHAANTGRGVHVFTSLLPPSTLSRQDFLPWETAQSAFLDASGAVAGSVAAELEARKLPYTTLVAPLRPMNNVAAPAIAIEIAPASDKVEEIAGAAYQEQVAQSIAAGIVAIRGKLPEVRP